MRDGIREPRKLTAAKGIASTGAIATTGLIGAVLAASCCVGPLVLVLLGVSGAWISNVTALAPYQPIFLVATVGLLGTGYWKVYRKPDDSCADDAYCPSPRTRRAIMIALWAGTFLIAVALGIDYLGPLFF